MLALGPERPDCSPHRVPGVQHHIQFGQSCQHRQHAVMQVSSALCQSSQPLLALLLLYMPHLLLLLLMRLLLVVMIVGLEGMIIWIWGPCKARCGDGRPHSRDASQVWAQEGGCAASSSRGHGERNSRHETGECQAQCIWQDPFVQHSAARGVHREVSRRQPATCQPGSMLQGTVQWLRLLSTTLSVDPHKGLLVQHNMQAQQHVLRVGAWTRKVAVQQHVDCTLSNSM